MENDADQLKAEATKFAKENRRRIAREITDTSIYLPEKNPVSVFMAGSPGAGKTEASKELLAETMRGSERRVLRIDADELRDRFPGYDGKNAALFQGAAAILVEKIHDKALEQGQSFLLDGTLSNYEKAEANVRRSLGRGRTVQILYVYQDPKLAWEFVKARESTEGRYVPPEEFVDQYFGARETANRSESDVRRTHKVGPASQNTDGSNRFSRTGVDRIDYHIPENYDRNVVRSFVGLAPIP